MNKPLDNEKAPHITETVRPAVYYMPTDSQQDDEINLVDIWLQLHRFRYMILGLTAVISLLAAAYALMAKPVYRAQTLLAPVGQESGGPQAALAGRFGGLASLAGINLSGGGGGIKERALAILKSRRFTRQFIDKHQMLPELFATQWDGVNKQWSGEPPTHWAAFKLFNTIRHVSDEKKTGMVRLSVNWRDPEKAALWTNQLVHDLNEVMRRQSITESEKSIAFLNQQLQKSSIVDLHQSIYRLIETQIKNIMLANAREEYAFQVVDPAVVPLERAFPNRRNIVIMGFFMGLVLSVFISFLWSWLSRIRDEASYQKP